MYSDEIITFPPDAELLFDGSSGQYIPQRFAQEIDRACVTDVSAENYEDLLKGPEYEWYWDVWDTVLNNAIITNSEGRRFWLYQDGDVWFMPCDTPLHTEENGARLADYLAEVWSEEAVRSELADYLYDNFEGNPEYFFDCAAETNRALFGADEEYASIPEYTLIALDRWAKRGEMGGHFIQALLENDLMKAFSRADTGNRNAMDAITKYIYNRLPAYCWGSPEKVAQWPAYLQEFNQKGKSNG